MRKAIRVVASLAAAAVMLLFGAAIYFDMTLPDQFYTVEGRAISFSSMPALSIEKASARDGVTPASGNQNATRIGTIKLFGIFPIKSAKVDTIAEKMLIPCGTPFGIKMFTDGVLVVGLNDVQTKEGAVNPAKAAGLKLGDSILTIDGKQMYTNEDVGAAIAAAEGKSLWLTIRRNGTDQALILTPALSDSDGKYKAGIWVRDSSAGIGTITYYDPATGCFGGLGHAICDVDTGDILPLMSGEVVEVSIHGIVKGQAGIPGELRGAFLSPQSVGSLLLNNETGVYGQMDYCPETIAKAMPLAMKQEVKTGKATILTTLDGKTPQEYEIEIERASIGSANLTKNMVIKVTDPTLLAKTGGIVQGMSGSPIIQNGKLVGAVTHVFVNDPTKGYGIFAENMLETAKSAEELKQAG